MAEQVELNEAQQKKFQELNDTWSVAEWKSANEPGVVLVIMDDGDKGFLYPDGVFVWDLTG